MNEEQRVGRVGGEVGEGSDGVGEGGEKGVLGGRKGRAKEVRGAEEGEVRVGAEEKGERGGEIRERGGRVKVG